MWQVLITLLTLFTSLSSFTLLFANSVFTSALYPNMHFNLLRTLPAASLVASAAAVNVHVSSYAGTITSFSLDKAGSGNYSLKQLGVINGSDPQPSWLEYRADKKVVYSLNEYWGDHTNGSIDVLKLAKDGSLQFVAKHILPNGPVSTISYNEGKGLAVAN